mmetsp:Transcript_175/g.324  ORF Transcript_175/g.324 Transcript_175/m.324 type:complete len:571 (+) Transcript_175:138-1850(+)
MVNNKKKRSKQKKAQRTTHAANNTNASRSSNGNRNAAHCEPSPIHHSPPSSDMSNMQDTFQGLSVQEMLLNIMNMKMRHQQLDDHVLFTRKLKGASAQLFAKGCESYLETAMQQCFDAPDELPVWCGLSPQQRMKLMVELMVGLLCEEEPLENIQTEQHFVAYMTIWRLLRTRMEVEMDIEGDAGYHDVDISEQLDAIRESCPSEDASEGQVRRKRTQAEKDEQERAMAIQSKLASRQKKKIAKNIEKGTEKFANDDNKLNPEGKDDSIAEDELTYCTDAHLFEGGPSPQHSRAHLRPTEVESASLYYTFKWRLLCDDAFQEEEDTSRYYFTPLKILNFNWKLNDLDDQVPRWYDALKILFIYNGVINYDAIMQRDMITLHFGELDDATYANPKHHQRILDVTKTTKQWRTSFDESHVDNTDFFKQQRCIYAITATELYYDNEDKKWLEAFCHACQEDNFSFKNVPGNYQKRLNAYRSVQDFDTPTTCYSHSHYTFEPPSTYNGSGQDMAGYCYEHCNEDRCYGMNTALFKCSGCKVVKYCSRECQKKDWPKHKKHCKVLGSMVKDKGRV